MNWRWNNGYSIPIYRPPPRNISENESRGDGGSKEPAPQEPGKKAPASPLKKNEHG
jgi:hypothetical protein